MKPNTTTSKARYSREATWLDLKLCALTQEQAATVRNTVAVTTGYIPCQREMLQSAAEQIGEPHFLVMDTAGNIELWRHLS